jgi:hypothetical protein
MQPIGVACYCHLIGLNTWSGDARRCTAVRILGRQGRCFELGQKLGWMDRDDGFCRSFATVGLHDVRLESKLHLPMRQQISVSE